MCLRHHKVTGCCDDGRSLWLDYLCVHLLNWYLYSTRRLWKFQNNFKRRHPVVVLLKIVVFRSLSMHFGIARNIFGFFQIFCPVWVFCTLQEFLLFYFLGLTRMDGGLEARLERRFMKILPQTSIKVDACLSSLCNFTVSPKIRLSPLSSENNLVLWKCI